MGHCLLNYLIKIVRQSLNTLNFYIYVAVILIVFQLISMSDHLFCV